jgi:hypothetical protein
MRRHHFQLFGARDSQVLTFFEFRYTVCDFGRCNRYCSPSGELPNVTPLPRLLISHLPTAEIGEAAAQSSLTGRKYLKVALLDLSHNFLLLLAEMAGHHYIGVDVGTGSARACIIDSQGNIKALASRDIRKWERSVADGGSHYVCIALKRSVSQINASQEQSTTDIWNAICVCVKKVVADSGAEVSSIKGIGFDATCSLAVLSHDKDEPVPVTGPDFTNDGDDRNVILWLDHRPLAETERINATDHNLLRYVGGTMSVEMEMPKVLWLKNNMPPELFDQCKFYDLVDALTHMATGTETRSFCSAVCKQGFVPVGVDGSVKGWQEDFYRSIGLESLVKDNFKRIGGVDGVVGRAPMILGPYTDKLPEWPLLKCGRARWSLVRKGRCTAWSARRCCRW